MNKLYFYSLVVYLTLIRSVGATGDDTEIRGRVPNPFKFGEDIFAFFSAVLDGVVLPVASVICVLSFIWAGFLYVTARGDKNQIAKAHKAFTYTAVGTAIVLGAWAIFSTISGTVSGLRS